MGYVVDVQVCQAVQNVYEVVTCVVFVEVAVDLRASVVPLVLELVLVPGHDLTEGNVRRAAA